MLRHSSAVIEMGANRRGDVEQLVQIARPGIGLITNAGAEHLEGFGSLEGAARAEGEMVGGLSQSGAAVINADDTYASLWRVEHRGARLQLRLAPRGRFSRHGVAIRGGRAGIQHALPPVHARRRACR